MLNTLVTAHDTRSLITTLEVGLFEPHDAEWTGAENATISGTELSGIIQSLGSLNSCPLDFQREFEIDLFYSSRDAMTTAILSLLPNLNSLTIRRSPIGRRWDTLTEWTRLDFTTLGLIGTLTLRFIELATTPPLAESALFKNLSYLNVKDIQYVDEDYSGWDSRFISVFLKLPALKTFFGSDCRDFNTNGIWTCDEATSAVTKVGLDHCKIGADTIQKILRSCRALDDFHCYRVCKACLSDVSTCDYSYADIHNDLFRHRKSLSTLQLDSQSCGHLHWRAEGPITTLVELENLKPLSVDGDVLFRHNDNDEYDEDARSLSEILPTGLQYIKIRGDRAGTQVGVFREVRRLLLSNANLASVTFVNAYIPDAEDMVEELSGVAIEMLGTRSSHAYGTFRLYRAESEQNEGVLDNER